MSVTFTITNGQMVAGNNAPVVAQAFEPTLTPSATPPMTSTPTATATLPATVTPFPTLTATLLPSATPTYLPSSTPALVPSATITETPIVVPTVFVPTAVAQVVVIPTQPAVIVIGGGQSAPPVNPTAAPPSVIVIGDPSVSVPPPVVVVPPVEQPPVEQPPVVQPPVVVPTNVPAPAPSAFSVISFTLVNIESGADIMTIGNGMTIDIATLGTRKITIRANTQGTVSSVIFGLDGNARYKVEDLAPFAIYDDTGRKYYAWPYTLGQHTVSGTPYAQQGGNGAAGGTGTVQFTLIDSSR